MACEDETYFRDVVLVPLSDNDDLLPITVNDKEIITGDLRITTDKLKVLVNNRETVEL